MKTPTLTRQTAEPCGLASPPASGKTARAARTPPRSPLRATQHLLARMNLALQIRAERRQLAQLSGTQLFDIGVTEAQRDQEVQRGAWHIPDNRLRRTRAVR